MFLQNCIRQSNKKDAFGASFQKIRCLDSEKVQKTFRLTTA